MKIVAKIAVLLLAGVTVLVFIWRGCFGTVRALRLSDGQVIGFRQMIGEVHNARLIFVGEIHEQAEHHKAQLEIIKDLYRAGVPLAIGLEMFPAGSQSELDRWVAGKLDQKSFVRLYYREWSMPWPLYRDIFFFARDNRIPLIGLNVPRDISHKVAREGFAALTPQERERLPAGITCSVDPAYRTFIARAYAEHARNGRSFNYFCEAQILWNKSMGRYLQEYLSREPGRTVVVMAGFGHAMKRGIPNEVSRSPGNSCKVILPELSGLDLRGVTSADADYLLLFNHVKRD